MKPVALVAFGAFLVLVAVLALARRRLRDAVAVEDADEALRDAIDRATRGAP